MGTLADEQMVGTTLTTGYVMPEAVKTQKSEVFGPSTRFSRYLTKDGDGTTFNANGNYSVTPASFRLVPDNARTFVLNILVVNMSGEGAWDVNGGYGNGPELLGGIVAILRRIEDDQAISDLTNVTPVRQTMDWASITGEFNEYRRLVMNPMDNSTAIAFPLTLGEITVSANDTGTEGSYLEVALSDDFTSRTTARHAFHALGCSLSEANFNKRFELVEN